MAFKPFEYFRKRQKVFLAGLAIMCMFLFVAGDVLMSRGPGQGGLFQRVQRWFGSTSGLVAKVGDTPLDPSRIMELSQRRRTVYQFISMVRQRGQLAALRDLGFTEAELQDPTKFQQKRQRLMQEKSEELSRLERPVDCLTQSLLRTTFSALEEANQVLLQFGVQIRIDPERDPLSPLNLAEFVYWLDRADDLDIVLDQSAVQADLLRMGRERLDRGDLAAVVRDARLGINVDTLLQWLTDELRAMIAKGVIEGPNRSNQLLSMMMDRSQWRPLSIQATPFDLWQAYVDVRTHLDVGILPIAVDQKEFLDQVGEPTTEQLRELYKKYSKQEPAPDREEPGFAIPKLHRVEFVYADLRFGTDAYKYYHRWAEAIKALDPVAFFGQALAFYEQNKDSRYRTRVVADPFVQKRLAGQWVLALGAMSAVGPAGSALVTGIVPPEEERIAPQDIARVAAGAATSIGLGLPGVFTYWPRKDYVTVYTPFSQVATAITEELTEDLERSLLENDLTQLRVALEKYGEQYRRAFNRWRKRPGATAGDTGEGFQPPPYTHTVDGKEVQTPINEYVESFAKKRGWQWFAMPEPRSRADLLREDPASPTPLGSILKPLFFKALASSLAAEQFDEQVKNLLLGTARAPRGVFEPAEEKYPTRRPWEFALYWKSQEIRRRVPSFEEAREKVRHAWKVLQARKIVEEHARTLAENAAAEPDGYRILKDRPGYTERRISRYQLNPIGAGAVSYRQATLPVIEYPTDDALDQILAQLRKPGQTMVVTNRPKSHYYVLVLRQRSQPDPTDSIAVKRFELEVLLAGPGSQIMIDRTPFPDFVVNQLARKHRDTWTEYFRDRIQFDQELADQYGPSRQRR